MSGPFDTLDDLEVELREMLQRRADDVTPDPPEWSDLIRRSESVVVSLQTGRRVDAGRERGRERGGGRGDSADGWRSTTAPSRRRPAWYDPRRIDWRRPSVVAVAAAMLTVLGMWLIDRSTAPDIPSLDAQAVAPAPGDSQFDPTTAPVVMSTDQAQPEEAARQYLEAAGIRTLGQEDAQIVVLSNDGFVAEVQWTRQTATGAVLQGTVLLRNLAAGTATGRWAVVGAVADGVELDDVRYDGHHLAFTVVNTTDDAPGSLAVTVLADGRPVSVGGKPLPQAGPADPALGELVAIGTDAGARKTIRVELVGRPGVLIRVQHVGGRQLSVTEMALDPPPITMSGVPGGGTDVDSPGPRDTRTGDSSPPAGGSVTSVPGTTVPHPPDDPLPTTSQLPVTTLPEPTIPETTLPPTTAVTIDPGPADAAATALSAVAPPL